MALLKNVSVLFSNVVNVDDFSNKYQLVVRLTEEQAADAEAEGLTVKNKEYEGKTQYQIPFKTQYRPRIVGPIASKDLDLEGSEIGRGSVVNIQYKLRDWVNKTTKQKGTSADLIAVQVMDLASGGATEFEDEESSFGDESRGSNEEFS